MGSGRSREEESLKTKLKPDRKAIWILPAPAEQLPNTCRSSVEQLPKPGRSVAEHLPKPSRTLAEAWPNNGRTPAEQNPQLPRTCLPLVPNEYQRIIEDQPNNGRRIRPFTGGRVQLMSLQLGKHRPQIYFLMQVYPDHPTCSWKRITCKTTKIGRWQQM